MQAPKELPHSSILIFMATLLGIDLGGTKLTGAVFSREGEILFKETVGLEGREGAKVGAFIQEQVKSLLDLQQQAHNPVEAIGIAVPGISRKKQGTVWAPNIPGWEDYPLKQEVQDAAGGIPVEIENDRACYILGEMWQGAARGIRDAIYLAIGTGIGAGICVDGCVLQGAYGIAGSIGWMGLNTTFEKDYSKYGCLEYYASGNGIARLAQKKLSERPRYAGLLAARPLASVSAHDVFAAYEGKDPIATEVIDLCVEYWGVAVANLVSLFNPEKIILGGGVFGPATRLIPGIKKVVSKWAQPISFQQVSIEASALGSEAGMYGAGWLAIQKVKPI